jgi:predicted enzyme related to lactoylglutathione lyase
MAEVRICIDVDDIDRAAVFYRDVLGLAPARRLGQSWVEMRGAHVMIDLLGTRSGSAPTPSLAGARRDFHRHWTPVHLDFVVDDLDAVVARALGAGATLDREIQVRPYGRMANMADPFGHGFCLLEMNERGYDALLDEPEDVS